MGRIIKDYTIANLARECNMDYKLLHYRLIAGWSVEDAVESSVKRVFQTEILL